MYRKGSRHKGYFKNRGIHASKRGVIVGANAFTIMTSGNLKFCVVIKGSMMRMRGTVHIVKRTSGKQRKEIINSGNFNCIIKLVNKLGKRKNKQGAHGLVLGNNSYAWLSKNNKIGE